MTRQNKNYTAMLKYKTKQNHKQKKKNLHGSDSDEKKNDDCRWTTQFLALDLSRKLWFHSTL